MKVLLLAGFAALLSWSQAVIAAEEPPATKSELTPEAQAEKDARKACEAKICDILATMDSMGDDIACDLVRTWSEDEIVDMTGSRINWPWGGAMCHAKVDLPREPLAKAMSQASYEMTMPTQTARCSLSQNDGGDPYVIEIAVAPKVKFENGKASEAQVNWGQVSAPMIIYPLIYAGTALDNSTNMLGPEIVRLVNEFTGKKCAQVKSELPKRRH
ncbi:MAG: hypothetical protein ACOYB4_07955 [Methyloceanibacter sp.]